MNILFVISAVIAVFSSAMTISRRNAVHALLFMVLSFLAMSMIFYSLGAAYAAILEVIVYAGTIIMFFVFTVMFLNMSVSPEDEKMQTGWKTWVVPTLLGLLLLIGFCISFFTGAEEYIVVKQISAKEVGKLLYTKYVLGVELAGFLLLTGVVGAYYLGRENKRNVHRYLQNIEN